MLSSAYRRMALTLSDVPVISFPILFYTEVSLCIGFMYGGRRTRARDKRYSKEVEYAAIEIDDT